MKIYHFKGTDGSVDVKVDQIGSAKVNLTAMEVTFNVTDATLKQASDPIDAFKRKYPAFASLKTLVHTESSLKQFAIDTNFELKVFDQNNAAVTLNSSSTTTTTTSSTTTTTTTTGG